MDFPDALPILSLQLRYERCIGVPLPDSSPAVTLSLGNPPLGEYFLFSFWVPQLLGVSVKTFSRPPFGGCGAAPLEPTLRFCMYELLP